MNENEFNLSPSAERESEQRWRPFTLRRPPWQFRLRTLLLIFVAASVVLSLIAFVVRRNQRHNQAVAKLEAAGAKVARDDNGWTRSVDLGFRPDGAAADPSKLVAPVWDAELVLLQDLPTLENLVLHQARVGDQELKHVAGLKNLRSLDLASTQITDKGLIHLQGLTRLESLDLTQTRITDSGLKQLANMKNLRVLNLFAGKYHSRSDRDPQITDAGLEHLSKLTELEELNLYAARVTDAGVAHLKELTNLRKLNLAHVDTKYDAAIDKEDGVVRLRALGDSPGTKHGVNDITDLEQITDAGLIHLQDLTKLEELDLTGTVVTDAGLDSLKALTNLRELGLGIRVTYEGVEKLQRALPNCKIYR